MESSSSSSSSTFQIDARLPKEISWGTIEFLQWEGFWYAKPHLAAVMAARSHFKARDEDVILASSMKTGSTWLKAIIPCIINSKTSAAGDGNGDNIDEEEDYDPFVEHHPNDLMPALETQIFRQDPNADLSGMPSPRLLRTHMPYSILPESIKDSACKIVYITRDPKDVFVSLWHFLNTRISCPLHEAFESFCNGVHPFGPFHDHVLGYWKESLKRPEKILFLKYEELKSDPTGQVRKLASFLGRPLVQVDEVDKLVWKCSFERLKNLEINRTGVDPHLGFTYKSYFRVGLVGDWKNHLSAEMRKHLDKITQTKLEGSGLEL
ncbi:cytosolic sulfotransferase 12-like [Hevea brasiliensis]|uniref:cytosolic sulfotransferase 12-like n=1 Tax=Hevea brasiliensis TaxID=3981 RepID=UPI0025D934A5|nr:cytosolic sulfotransferase 12-like [Hevea brasiliensis]